MSEEEKITITESEAKEAEANSITREEAIAQGIDVEKVEAEAVLVDVVKDEVNG